MTQNLGDVFDLRYCEICKSSNEDNEGIPGKVSNSEDDAGFILCHKGHRLFPAKCGLCKSSWKSFVRDGIRILCVSCDYPVHVFDQASSSSPDDSQSQRLFPEAPGFLVCGCCEQFDVDLFTLLPLDDTHIYFQCLVCFLEMVVVSKNASSSSKSGLWSTFRRSKGNPEPKLSDKNRKFSEDSFMAYLSDEEFRRVLDVARSRMGSLEDKLNGVYPFTFDSQGTDPPEDEKPRVKSRTLTDLIDSLIKNDNVRDNLKQALKKVPAVTGTLLGLVVGARMGNPKAGQLVTTGGTLVIETICNIIVGEMDKRSEKLKNEEEYKE